MVTILCGDKLNNSIDHIADNTLLNINCDKKYFGDVLFKDTYFGCLVCPVDNSQALPRYCKMLCHEILFWISYSKQNPLIRDIFGDVPCLDLKGLSVEAHQEKSCFLIWHKNCCEENNLAHPTNTMQCILKCLSLPASLYLSSFNIYTYIYMCVCGCHLISLYLLRCCLHIKTSHVWVVPASKWLNGSITCVDVVSDSNEGPTRCQESWCQYTKYSHNCRYH